MEQPREKRVRVKAPVSFEGKAGVGRGMIFNLSLGGCALESPASVERDATIRLNLQIPTDKKPVRVSRAKVIWTAGDDFGVEFLSLGETSRIRLRRFLDGFEHRSPRVE